jgi:hypothetical protein
MLGNLRESNIFVLYSVLMILPDTLLSLER